MLQPRSYRAFQCVGADCEDTCCIGWIVQVDKRTYDSYQRCDDPDLGPRLRELVTINDGASSDDSFARIALPGHGCPFLAEGLCSIQSKLGEPYLSNMCAQYPRVVYMVDSVQQRSLDLSCPEAARIVLLDPNPMEFEQEEQAADTSRGGGLSQLNTDDPNPAKPYRFYGDIRAFLIWLLQYRVFPLWKRLAILASFCDELEKVSSAGQTGQIPMVLTGFREAVTRDLFGPGLDKTELHPSRQLELSLDCIVSRITSDYTPPRFLASYQEFMKGIEWTAESAMSEIGQRYASASTQYFAPFLSRHEYIFEHYLVSYVFRTLFPLGPQKTSIDLGAHAIDRSVREHGLLLLIYFGLMQTVLIGMAGLHKSELNTGHAIRAIQAAVKTFEHSLTFPQKALEILKAGKIHTCIGLALILRT